MVDELGLIRSNPMLNCGKVTGRSAPVESNCRLGSVTLTPNGSTSVPLSRRRENVSMPAPVLWSDAVP